jgi:hypothetical protein
MSDMSHVGGHTIRMNCEKFAVMTGALFETSCSIDAAIHIQCQADAIYAISSNKFIPAVRVLFTSPVVQQVDQGDTLATRVVYL